MILAEVIVDGNFTTYAQEALFFLVLVGGGALSLDARFSSKDSIKR